VPVPTSYLRYVALGDSQTEGLNDGSDASGLRGWADRFAESLAATTSPDLRYANLAIRGCRARDVRHRQLDAALALEPDLASVVVGMNDLLRHDYDADATVRDIEETFAALRAIGCRVVTMTFPDIGRMLPVMAWLRPREVELSRRLVEAAERHDVAVLDVFPLEMCGDPALWSHDRIHGSSEGHRRIAAGMAEVLELPGSDDTWSASAPVHAGLLDAVRRDVWWTATFVVPFLTRMLMGRGPGTGRTAKRPELLRVLLPAGGFEAVAAQPPPPPNGG
jgi:lysophospholipase L1-like esterase